MAESIGAAGTECGHDLQPFEPHDDRSCPCHREIAAMEADIQQVWDSIRADAAMQPLQQSGYHSAILGMLETARQSSDA